MSTSPKNKLPLGMSGLEDSKVLLPEVPNHQEVVSLKDDLSMYAMEPDAVAVEGSDEPEKEKLDGIEIPLLSLSDLKLARRMSKHISDSLGLSGKSRSVII